MQDRPYLGLHRAAIPHAARTRSVARSSSSTSLIVNVAMPAMLAMLSAGVDRRRTDETLPDRRYGAAVDPHVAYGVEPRLGIDDPTARQHQVVRHEPTSSDRSPRRR